MALRKWGFVYTLGERATTVRRDVLGDDDCVLIAIGLPSVTDAAAAARQLVDEGAELVEFCGAFGAGASAPAIAAAATDGVPVGSVTYGGDATEGLHRLFGPG